MNRISRVLGSAAFVSAFTGCAPPMPAVPPQSVPDKEFTACPDRRPQMCTKEYQPVCATRDTGVRCVTTPCPSTERITMPNSCDACSDQKVIGHTPGSCTLRQLPYN